MRNMIILACVMGLLLGLALAATPGKAFAQKKPSAGKDNVSAEKDIASKQGVSESLGKKEWDKDKLPGKWKIGFGFGSLALAVFVMKWF